ncbi:hypothetical protein AJ78_05053 [Emergomyces pasteurianus Ep9510]|uniref:Uncharacterized protein n=1 Tax=Emergomyces pasteurianus Ep9510 TaxID=1447872 RepID=A0A1J9QER2_9EURO|nr:hypothetical protein AJ78_05053 [Emergomyces pasteurianus Ep9510]
MLRSAAECHRFLESQNAAAIAAHIRRDKARCKKNGLPSILAWYLPPASSILGDTISIHLHPDDGFHNEESTGIRHLLYESTIQSLKAYLSQMDQQGFTLDGESPLKTSTIIPATHEFEATLKVLEYLQDHSSMTNLASSSPLSEVISAVETQLHLGSKLRAEYRSMAQDSSPQRREWKKKKCYICCFKLTESHRLYPSLCRPCGNFNLAGSEASLPENLNLEGMTALVTGGRINLGYHTVLRLLRCGARVIASTRYPRDAETRYQEEPDFKSWAHRLKIVGADFRSAKDAFRLVQTVQKVLLQWKDSSGGGSDDRQFEGLNILINNAAQTLTDPLKSESRAVNKEETLRTQATNGRLLVDNDRGYEARVRGGMGLSWTTRIEGHSQFLLEGAPWDERHSSEQANHPPQKGLRGDIVDAEDGGKSSWTQALQEIPYEDMISAHSVNAFVPLILCRELLPLMARGRKAPLKSSAETTATSAEGNEFHHSSSAMPCGYIINVSSREGLFEVTPKHSHKMGRHVHTNMSKAAINMITETEAAPTWIKHRIAMNTVDPGYMSAAPEFQQDDGCPIGFEDGAARVLWPIAVGIKDKTPVWGRFLKHFGEVYVQTGLGRGIS